VVALLVCALVESGHRLISRPSLDLHEIRAGVLALWTLFVATINVFPGRCSAKHVVNLFQLGVAPVRYALGDIVDVGTSRAGKAITGALSLLALKDISAGGTEEQHQIYLRASGMI